MNARVVLVGPMGAGKSTIGVALAKSLDAELIDTDQRVELETGQAIADIFVEHGESHFRALERDAVAAAVATNRAIVSLGGGAVLDPDTRADLHAAAAAGTVVVFLDASWATVSRRIGLNRSRPLLVDSPRRRWLELMEQRRGLYEQVSTLTVNVDDHTVAETVNEILRKVRRAH